jgi:hypothetical protein
LSLREITKQSHRGSRVTRYRLLQSFVLRKDGFEELWDHNGQIASVVPPSQRRVNGRLSLREITKQSHRGSRVTRYRLLQSFVLRKDGFEEIWDHKVQIASVLRPSQRRFKKKFIIASDKVEKHIKAGFDFLNKVGPFFYWHFHIKSFWRAASFLLCKDGFTGLWGNNRQIASVLPIAIVPIVIGSPSQRRVNGGLSLRMIRWKNIKIAGFDFLIKLNPFLLLETRWI